MSAGYGFFDRTINWVEMVLANGEIVKASSTDNAELFYGCASSFGTLGVYVRKIYEEALDA